MRKCVRVKFETKNAQKVLKDFIAKQAKQFLIEGLGQEVQKDNIQLLVCGQDVHIDDFVDALYVGNKTAKLEKIEVEPCVIERPFRGVFRVVE